MIADERQEAEQVWEKIRQYPRFAARAVSIIAAARVRWQNEALEDAANIITRGVGALKSAQKMAQEIRALKK